MTILIGALIIGFIIAFLAIGVFISFKVVNFADLSPEGTFPLGASIAAALLVGQYNPFVAVSAAFGAGFLSGCITAILHTRFKINQLLSGILIMTGLYSVNLHIMGKSNIPLMNEKTVFSFLETFLKTKLHFSGSVIIASREISVSELSALIFVFGLCVIIAIALYLFFKTDYGTAMRATGNNDQMMKALGGNTNSMTVIGLGIANGLVALSGALIAQYQGFADVQMGLGILVSGLASMIIGENLIKDKTLGFLITGTIIGSLIFRMIVAAALRGGMNPNDLKLITAAFVFIALIIPGMIDKIKDRKGRQSNA